jgi:uncharacterized protein (TIGR02444 family)
MSGLKSDVSMTDFWDWAVAAYAGEGVAEACLRLQDDHGQCVPLLLWAAWRVHEGQGVGETDAVKAALIARTWSNDVVTPLRQVRRRLKTLLDEGDEAIRLPLREKIKALELDAERALMARLSDMASENSYLKQDIDVGLLRVAGAWSAMDTTDGLKDGLARLAEALTKA